MQLWAASIAPGDNFRPGWMLQDQPLHFAGGGLFNYIDGAAELFTEFGFQDVEVCRYGKGERELDLELYRMENSDAALGVYLMKCGKETPLPGVRARNSADPYQLIIVKGPYFVVINNFSGDATLFPVMTDLANFALNNIQEGEKTTLLDILPGKNLIAGSELLFRGPTALQQIYVLGQGDVLQLKGTIFGVAGDYAMGNDERYTMMCVAYPDGSAARSAYENLFRHLDGYITILDRGEGWFIFSDYNKKFGVAKRKDATIEITVNLCARPPK